MLVLINIYKIGISASKNDEIIIGSIDEDIDKLLKIRGDLEVFYLNRFNKDFNLSKEMLSWKANINHTTPKEASLIEKLIRLIERDSCEKMFDIDNKIYLIDRLIKEKRESVDILKAKAKCLNNPENVKNKLPNNL